jgi:GT2 family glycosyltransferase/SAM-dependent methyltransferase
MNPLHRLHDYYERALQIWRDKGFLFVIKAIQFKLRSRLFPRTMAPLDAWLTFYRNQTPVSVQSAAVPKVSILILTYNNLPVTQTCLYSLYANTEYPNFEIVVVDNASSDNTAAWLSEFAQTHPNLRVLLNDHNRGFAAGNNQAAQAATGEYLIFLNNDTVVPKGWVEGLLAYAHNDPMVGLVGPVTNATGNEARIPITYTTPAEMEIFAAQRARAFKGHSFDIRMLALYCVLTRKDQFTTIGGLDERFGVGMFEDDDLAVRYQQHGLRVICADDVFIHHFQSMSFNKLKRDYYNKLFAENRKKYEEKWDRTWEPYHYRAELLQQVPTVMNTHPSQKPWGTLRYRCNICGSACETRVEDLGRETPTCTCGSTVRSRAIIHLLSIELFGHSLALPDFPQRPEIRGWGMSDGGYPNLLAKKIGYINTFYHREPRFDITAPMDPALTGTLDFLISTEVFEHIVAPVTPAFENARRILKPSGVLIFTVPYTLDPETREHFPELYQYEIINPHGVKPVLKNITRDGRQQVFDNLVFHGGPGSTLEMRVFSQAGLFAELEKAGFTARIHAEPCWEFGIHWQHPWSLPIVARLS